MEAQRISTLDMSKDQWLEHRYNGIGGSEVSSVLGLNPYKSSAELWWEKVLRVNRTEENQAMHWGKALEDVIADRWQYWDGDAEQMIKNFNEGNIKRKCRRVNAILTNPACDWLFANVDRYINLDITTLARPGILEIKTVSGWAVDQWKDGIPPYYLIQLQTYLLVTGYNYGEIVILRDGRFMEVIPFSREEQIIDKIIERTKVFWESVEAARTIIDGYNLEQFENPFEAISHLPDNLKEQLFELEPAPDDSVAYENYLKERYRIVPSEIQGSPELRERAIAYQSYNESIKHYEGLKRGCANILKAYMKESDVMNFEDGKVTHREDSRGARRLTVKMKGGKE